MDLIKRLRYIALFRNRSDAQSIHDAAEVIETAIARIATLELALREIAMADTEEWDEPFEYEKWAKEKASAALNKPKGK